MYKLPFYKAWSDSENTINILLKFPFRVDFEKSFSEQTVIITFCSQITSHVIFLVK